METGQTLSHESINLLGLELSKLYYLLFLYRISIRSRWHFIKRKASLTLVCLCIFFFVFALKDDLVIHGT